MQLTQKRRKKWLKFSLTSLALLGAILISVRCSHMNTTTSSTSVGHRLPNSYEKGISDETPPSISRVKEVPEGLSGDDAANFYHLSEGSDVYPYEWFKALRSVDSVAKRTGLKGFFASPVSPDKMSKFHENLEGRFGILNDPKNQTLKGIGSTPIKKFLMSEVGLTAAWSDHHPTQSDAFQEDEGNEVSSNNKDTNKDKKKGTEENRDIRILYRDIDSNNGNIKSIRMVGTNCALCHTSELTTKSGQHVRLDGGSNIFNVRAFFQDMSKSTVAMLYNELWLAKFLEDLKVKNPEDRAKEVHEFFMTEVGKATRKGQLLEAIKNEIKTWPKEEREFVSKLLQLSDKYASGVRESFQELRNAIVQKFVSPELSTKITLLLAKLGRRERLYEAQDAIAKSLVKLLRVTYGFSDNDNLGVLEARMRYLGNMVVGADPKIHETIAGYARTDAFGRIGNLVLRGKNPVDLTGEVSFPWIWGIKYKAWLHYNANTNSVTLRNTGQALGLGALVTDSKLNSTVNLYNLDRLEHLVHKIKYPQWTQLFPSYQSANSEFYIDIQKASEGKKIYQNKCKTCHESNIFVGPNSDERKNKLRYFNEFPLKAIGTDETVAYNATESVNNMPFEDAILTSVKGIKDRYYQSYKISKEKQAEMEFAELRGPEFFRDTVKGFNTKKMSKLGVKYGEAPVGQGYTARHLSSVWATGPFLHNGSVPTIWDLLQPSSKRPKYFNVLSREFDSKKLGFKNQRPLINGVIKKCEEHEDSCFNTEPWGAPDRPITTNVNTGHEGVINWTTESGEIITWDFGTEMSDNEKRALIEYLKVLPPDSEYNWQERKFEDSIN